MIINYVILCTFWIKNTTSTKSLVVLPICIKELKSENDMFNGHTLYASQKVISICGNDSSKMCLCILRGQAV